MAEPSETWDFYGRNAELAQINAILERKRWFFLQISGRRRIGKTSLIRQALIHQKIDRTLYIQIPDSDPAGVVAAVNGYLELFNIERRASSLADVATLVGEMVRAGYVVALDEFQYFHRKSLSDFCSMLQAEVDSLAQDSAAVPGGLIVSGSVHSEMAALLEDRNAPLYNRTTDVLQLDHLDIGSLKELLLAQVDLDPMRLLFLWNLFEGVPKFYRDAWERGVLSSSRQELLEHLFFTSSSPLRNEADNWFLRELRGRYDVVLQHVAEHPGVTHAEMKDAMARLNAGDPKQVGGYLQTLEKRFRMIERRLPILSSSKSRGARYYLSDNFLRSWLSALQRPVSAIAFRPMQDLIAQADERLAGVEGYALEDLAAHLYEERSRMGIGDFQLTHRVQGYWDRSDTEIDLVVMDEDNQRIRFCSCRRNGDKLPKSIEGLKKGASHFLSKHRHMAGWTIEWVAIAPVISRETTRQLDSVQVKGQSLTELLEGV